MESFYGKFLWRASLESFFGTPESELFYVNRFNTVEQLLNSIHRYIHGYNHPRIKTKLKGLSPVQCRTQTLST